MNTLVTIIKAIWYVIVTIVKSSVRVMQSPFGHFMIGYITALTILIGLAVSWLEALKFAILTVAIYFVTYTGLALLGTFTVWLYRKFKNRNIKVA